MGSQRQEPGRIVSCAAFAIGSVAGIFAATCAAAQDSWQEALAGPKGMQEVEDVVTLTIGSADAAVGSKVEIPVEMRVQGPGPMTVVMTIVYDGTRLDYLDATLGPLVPKGKTLEVNDLENEILLVVFGLDTDIIPEGVLVRIEFSLIDDGSREPIPLVAEEVSSARTNDDTEPAVPLLTEAANGEVRPTDPLPGGCHGANPFAGNGAAVEGLLLVCLLALFTAGRRWMPIVEQTIPPRGMKRAAANCSLNSDAEDCATMAPVPRRGASD